MTPRCHHCRARLTQDETIYYGDFCERCEARMSRRWDDQYPNRPSKFAQRIAIVMAIAIIFACVAVMKKLGGG